MCVTRFKCNQKHEEITETRLVDVFQLEEKKIFAFKTLNIYNFSQSHKASIIVSQFLPIFFLLLTLPGHTFWKQRAIARNDPKHV